MSDIDIDSIVVHSTNSGNFPSFPDFNEDEWYPARIDKVDAIPNKYGSKNLRWRIELLDDKFSYEYNDATKYHSVMYTTSALMSPSSRLYQLYCKVKDIDGFNEGEKPSVKSLIGKSLMIMLEKNPRTDGKAPFYINVKDVKAAKKTVDSNAAKKEKKEAPKLDPIVNSDNVVKPEDIQFTPEETSMFEGLLS